ncbi:hypothetical protein L7F22_022248 [Adiantum nelumboides]|nr:hypothetical protein [Adiantum nelumboides]
MSIDDIDFAHEDATDDTAMLVNYLVTWLQQAMGNLALQGEVQQQIHAWGILPPPQQERDHERSHGETSKRFSTAREVENPYHKLKKLLVEGKPSSKKKGHAQHERSPSKEREGSESQENSMEDVAPRRRRAQRSQLPQSRRGLHIVLTVVNQKERRRAQGRRRRERGHPLLHIHHPLPLLTKVASSQEKQRSGHQRSYATWKKFSKIKKFKEGGKNISFLTYDGTFGATDKVLAFIQQFDAAFGDDGFTESSKLRHVAMHFQKSARQWWANLRANGEAPKTWKALRASIMKQFLASNAKDKVLTKWRSLKLSPYESIHKYVDKFWDLHLKATVYKKIYFEEQKQQLCAGFREDMKEYVNSQRPRSISTVIHHTMVAARINFQQGAKRNLKPMEAKDKQEYKGKNLSQNSSKGNSNNTKAKEKGVFKGMQDFEMGDAMKADGAFIGQDVYVTPLIGKLRLHIQGYVDKQDFFIFPLKHEDVILGPPWFHRLAASIKFPERKVSFKFREKDMYINAQESGSTIPLVNDQAFDKSIKSSVFAYMIFVKDSLNGVYETQVNESGMQVDLELSNFLNQFQDVFIDDIPGELPPKRGDDDHTIEFIPGSSPPNKPPYRVSQAQQEEIMRQVNEVVEKGMVRPSSSPFFSPVLLVQKKDGTYSPAGKKVTCANNASYPIKGVGKILITISDGSDLCLPDVLYVPGIKKNLLFVSSLAKNGLRVIFEDDRCIVRDRENGYSLITTGCVLQKMHRFAFSQDGYVRATRKLQLVHSDVCGPMRTSSVGNILYFVTFIDDFSRFCWVYPLKAKSDVFAIFQHYVSMVENETGCKVQTLRTDRGGEYMSGAFKDFLGKKGIKHQCTMPYTPQQNGVAERKNRSLMEMARCMLKAKSLPHKLWMEAVACAAHVLNRCPTRALKTITLYESWYDRKPSVNCLRVFGCLAYAHIPQQLRGKLDDKAVKCIFVGYSSGSKGYRLYNPATNKIFESRDVIFAETTAQPMVAFDVPHMQTQDVFEGFLPSFVENQESQQVDNFDQSFDQHVTPHDVEEIVREEQEVLREERTLPEWVQKTLQDSKLDAPLPRKTRAGPCKDFKDTTTGLRMLFCIQPFLQALFSAETVPSESHLHKRRSS